jgi:hypothetical protein
MSRIQVRGWRRREVVAIKGLLLVLTDGFMVKV